MTIHSINKNTGAADDGTPSQNNETLKAIVYTSRVAEHITNDADLLLQVIEKSASANLARDVSGAMLLNNRQFLQIIEGSEQAIEALFKQIFDDNRHTDIVVLYDAEISSRSFGDWAMHGLIADDPSLFDAETLVNIKTIFDQSFTYSGNVFLKMLKSVFNKPAMLARMRNVA